MNYNVFLLLIVTKNQKNSIRKALFLKNSFHSFKNFFLKDISLFVKNADQFLKKTTNRSPSSFLIEIQHKAQPLYSIGIALYYFQIEKYIFVFIMEKI